jgi:hypothetical protein
VTEKLQLAVLPCPSFAVQITVVVPTPNALPLAGMQLTPGLLQLSVPVGAKVTLLEQLVPEVVTMTFAGQTMVGG